MILTIRTPNDASIKQGDNVWLAKMGLNVQTLSYVLGVTPELTEKEKVLSQLFGLNISQELKEILAKVVNKAYERE